MKFKDIEDTLPNTLHELLEVALQELEQVEKLPDHQVEMRSWYAVFNEGDKSVCQVCLAGAALRKLLPTQMSAVNIHPGMLCDSLKWKLEALNALRHGHILSACLYLDITVPAGLPDDFFVADYAWSPTDCKADLHRLVDLLKQHQI